MNPISNKSAAIVKALQTTESDLQMEMLLRDLLSDSEIAKIYDRIKVMECLYDNISQREVSKKTDVAIATVSRGAKLSKSTDTAICRLIKENKNKPWWKRLIWPELN